MKLTTRRMIYAAAMAISITGTANAATLNWDGPVSGGAFETLANWQDSVTLVDPTAFTTSDTMNITNGSTVTRSASLSVGRTNVQGGSILNVTGGTQSDGTAGTTVRNFVGNGSTGTVNVSGASTLYDVGHVTAIAHSTNSNGTVTVSNGATYNGGRGSNSLVGGYGGNFALGHTISIGGNNNQTNVTGLFEISGSSTLKTRTGVAVGKGGTFSQIGSSVVLAMGGANTDAGWFGVTSDGTWKVAADSGGVSKVFIEAQTNTSTQNAWAEFQNGAILDLSFVSTPTAGTWTLLELEGQDIIDGGLTLAAGNAAAGWSFLVDNTGTNGLLTVTYVPEPSIALLGGLGLLGLLRRRRH